MSSLNRIIFISSLSIIILIIGFRTLVSLTPLEYSSDPVEELVDTITGICLPVAIAFTLTGTLRDRDHLFTRIGKVSITLFAAFISMLISIAAGIQFCGWSESHIIYYHNQSPEKTIIMREFGCGATDSEPGRPGVFQITPVIPGLNWVIKFDTANLDHTKWLRYENRQP